MHVLGMTSLELQCISLLRSEELPSIPHSVLGKKHNDRSVGQKITSSGHALPISMPFGLRLEAHCVWLAPSASRKESPRVRSLRADSLIDATSNDEPERKRWVRSEHRIRSRLLYFALIGVSSMDPYEAEDTSGGIHGARVRTGYQLNILTVGS